MNKKGGGDWLNWIGVEVWVGFFGIMSGNNFEFNSIGDFMGYIAMFLMIGALIFVHELGHFIAAKMFGIGVRQFSVGFGRKLFSFMYKETEYKISVFPVGGYVMPDVEELEDYFSVFV